MPLGGKGPSVLACLWAQTAVTLTCITLRWYTRHYIKGKVGADDYVLWLTWVRICYHVAGHVDRWTLPRQTIPLTSIETD